MCGIAGVFNFRGPRDAIPALIASFNGAQRHRGPDQAGAWTAAEFGAGLAATRLAVVGIDDGSQPLVSHSGETALACNGEIYNHRELRKELEERGHRFRSRSDCEVILHLYEESGTAALGRLEGMFALALVDRTRRRLLLARDPIGMKHLYYGQNETGWFFASELKALFASGLLRPEADLAALGSFLSVGFVPSPHNGFRGVQKVEPGSYVAVEDGRASHERYWIPRFRNAGASVSDEAPSRELDGLLGASVRRHLDADVPVGLFLSGGWDSSLVSHYAVTASSRSLKTFSLVFPDHPEVDESHYAGMVARALGTDHREVEVRNADLLSALPAVVRAVEEPCSVAPAALLYLLAETAGRELKVVMGGEGADELFAGYAWLRPRWYDRWRGFLPFDALRRWSEWLPRSDWRRTLRILAARDSQSAYRETWGTFPHGTRSRLFKPEFWRELNPEHPFRVLDETWSTCRDSLESRLSLELTGRLPNGVLLVNDKVSMAHSLELRMPMLDSSVVAFALALDSNQKRRGPQEKYVLSHLAKRYLPPSIAARQKRGLRIPYGDLLRSKEGQNYLRPLLLDARSGGELFDRPALERWLRGARGRARDDNWLLWRLILVRLWWDEFLTS